VTAEELKDFVKAEIAPYKCPREIHFVAELPKTPTGKLQRFRLRDRSSVVPADAPAAAADG
jgi:2-aminobenzoate-CoA ligase